MAEIQEPTPIRKQDHGHGLYYLLLLVAIALVAVVYFWQHSKVADLSLQVTTQKVQVADREKALSSLPNTVQGVSSSSMDLVAFLGSDNTGCYKPDGDKGYYKVIKELNGTFAKMQYGCEAGKGNPPSGPPAYILAKKAGDAWQLISPTNQWSTIDGKDLPSCKMINENKVSKLLEPQCYTQSGGNAGASKIEMVTNP